MEYRKKNLKPKQKIEETINKALANEDFMGRIDFVGSCRKTAFMNQNEH